MSTKAKRLEKLENQLAETQAALMSLTGIMTSLVEAGAIQPIKDNVVSDDDVVAAVPEPVVVNIPDWSQLDAVAYRENAFSAQGSLAQRHIPYKHLSLDQMMDEAFLHGCPLNVPENGAEKQYRTLGNGKATIDADPEPDNDVPPTVRDLFRPPSRIYGAGLPKGGVLPQGYEQLQAFVADRDAAAFTMHFPSAKVRNHVMASACLKWEREWQPGQNGQKVVMATVARNIPHVGWVTPVGYEKASIRVTNLGKGYTSFRWVTRPEAA